MSLKLAFVLLWYTIVIIISPTLCKADEYNEKLEQFVTVKPNSAFLVRPTLQNGKIVFMQLQLPEQITDLKAFVWDPVHHIPLFSGGDPNKIVAYTGHDDNFDIIVEDVLNVTSMEIDLNNELLLWIDSGKNVVEKMSLKTLERSIELTYENDDFKVINETISITYPDCKKHCDQPLWGKVFKERVQFRGNSQQSYKLMHHRESGKIVTASWDGNNFVFSSENANVYDMSTKELTDHTYMNSIYCGNYNGVAALSM